VHDLAVIEDIDRGGPISSTVPKRVRNTAGVGGAHHAPHAPAAAGVADLTRQVSHATPSPSRSSEREYPGSPLCSGAAPALRTAAQFWYPGAVVLGALR
jgi:hypothetical protein